MNRGDAGPPRRYHATVTRAELMAALGPMDYPPTEAMIEEVEAIIEATARRVAPGRPIDRSVLGLGPIEGRIADWKRRHNLFPRERGTGGPT